MVRKRALPFDLSHRPPRLYGHVYLRSYVMRPKPRFRLAHTAERRIAWHEYRLLELLRLDAPPLIIENERRLLSRWRDRYRLGCDYWSRRDR